jgi:hypothetical protein
MLPTHRPLCVPAAGEAEEGGEGKVTEGTGLGEGDTTGAKDISNEVGAPLPACLPAYPVPAYPVPAYPVYCQACLLTSFWQAPKR